MSKYRKWMGEAIRKANPGTPEWLIRIELDFREPYHDLLMKNIFGFAQESESSPTPKFTPSTKEN
jgi:hypothetical protein